MVEKDFSIKNGLQVGSGNWVVNAAGLFFGNSKFQSSGGYYKGNAGIVGEDLAKQNLYKINTNTQSNNITIAAGENAITVGPITIADGFNLTIEEDGRAVIV